MSNIKNNLGLVLYCLRWRRDQRKQFKEEEKCFTVSTGDKKRTFLHLSLKAQETWKRQGTAKIYPAYDEAPRGRNIPRKCLIFIKANSERNL